MKFQKTDYHGIDYGLGRSNISPEGIRYGVIPARYLASWIWDEVQMVFWCGCPKCCEELPQDFDVYENPCPKCGAIIEDGEQWSDDPVSRYFDDGVTRFLIDDDEDVWIFKSAVVTHAQFCSPCAPGACYLPNPTEESGPLCYCLGPEWFEDEVAPYDFKKVEEVSNGAG